MKLFLLYIHQDGEGLGIKIRIRILASCQILGFLEGRNHREGPEQRLAGSFLEEEGSDERKEREEHDIECWNVPEATGGLQQCLGDQGSCSAEDGDGDVMGESDRKSVV